MKKIITICLSGMLLLSVCGCGNSGAPAPEETKSAASPVESKKVAYIMQMQESDIFQMWSESAEKTAEGLGMEYEAFFCDGSDEKWRETVEQCAAEGYDGLLLSHGGQDYAYTFLSDIKEQYPDLKLVTFDTQFYDENGQEQKIDGVTQYFQQDAQLSKQLLDYICNDLYAEKTAAGEPVNILKVWVGPGFLAPFDRRQAGYEEYENNGLIKTVETIGPADFADAESSMAEVTAATLAKYGDGEIDAIWCCYDLYANGVYKALTENGYDIPMVSADICNADIEKMAQTDSVWKACATANWYYNGEFGMRVLSLELADEYDKIIDPMTGESSDRLEIPTYIVTQDMVSGGNIDVSNLETVAGAEYSDRSWMPETDWMKGSLGN